MVSCLFRLEGVRSGAGDARGGDGPLAEARGKLLWASCPPGPSTPGPNGSGPAGGAGVEYVLAPDPNVGPFEPLTPGDVSGWSGAG